MAQARLQRDRPALGEAREHDARAVHAAAPLARDELFNLGLRLADAALVGQPRDVVQRDVIPGAHVHAVVDGDGALGRVGEDEAQRQRGGQRQLAHDGHEVPAVGAEAVQPDDGAGGIGAGGELDVGQQLQIQLRDSPSPLGEGWGERKGESWGEDRSADLGRNAFTTSARVSR